jgi:hypothetical protein
MVQEYVRFAMQVAETANASLSLQGYTTETKSIEILYIVALRVEEVNWWFYEAWP